MFSRSAQPRRSLLYRSLNRVVQTVASMVQATDRAMVRASAQVRQVLVHPLRPSPLIHVAAGGGTNSSNQAISAQETLMLREHHHPLGIAGLPPATLQHAHAFLKQLPVWLPIPQTRRHGQCQVALEWAGEGDSRLSVRIGRDGMIIYSARLGARGRLDGAEPIGEDLSPVLNHVIRQLNP